MQKLRILHQDPHLVVVEKPAGLLVHPPEDAAIRKYSAGSPDMVRILRNQTGFHVYPVHRLDRATHGVMVMAFSSAVASALQAQFGNRTIEKEYLLLCRGWTADSGLWDSPLESEKSDSGEVSAETEYETLHRFELPIASKRHPTSRFSLVRASPRTGRFHQIRRHFKGASHPLIGDSVHGDGRQNRIWRELTGASRLYLTAWKLGFRHPVSNEHLQFRARFTGAWHTVFERAGFCPLLQEFSPREYPLRNHAG